MWWGRTQHVQHELLARLRTVENDRWMLRCASSGRSESIDPRGKPSAEGVEIGTAGVAEVGYAHRSSFALGGRLYFLGPAAALGTLAYAVVAGVGSVARRIANRKPRSRVV
jgi:apolipoprotein N-acyltransferase